MIVDVLTVASVFLSFTIGLIVSYFLFASKTKNVETRDQYWDSESSNCFLKTFGESNDDFEPILISIEGNIGAGKSTLLNLLRKKHPEWTFIDEPVHLWSNFRNEKRESILEVFYKDKDRWSFTFQNCALLTRYEMIEETIRTAKAKGLRGKQIFITERCLDSDYHVFTKMLRADGSMDSLEFTLYERLLHQLQGLSNPLNAIVFVDTFPDICLQRIKIRGRTGEEAIPSQYLQNLHQYQSTWVNSTSVPILRSSQTDSVDQIENFIRSFQK